MLHISLAAETLWTILGFPVSNALLTTWIVMGALLLFAYLATRRMSTVPSSIQLFAELIVGGLYDFFGSIAGKHIRQFFPLVATFFIFILLGNWIGLLPGVGTIGYFRSHAAETAAEEHAPEAAPEPGQEAAVPDEVAVGEHTLDAVETFESQETQPETSLPEEAATGEEKEEVSFVPLLRGVTADLNTTLALGVISVFAMQVFGWQALGSSYLQRYFNFKDPILFGVGFLEIVSDLSKIMSFAFRLFGNIFAGEVLLAVMAFLMPFVVPLPFLLMELFVGIVQALVFSMLSTAFFTIAVAHE